MEWNLKDLYKSINDKRIKKDKNSVVKALKKFTKIYKGKLNSPKRIEEAIKVYEDLMEKVYWITCYAGFLHSKDTKSSEIGSFYQESNEFYSKIFSDLSWFEIELARSNHKVKNYSYFLRKLRKNKDYMLSEEEESIMTQKSLTSSDAFTRFYDETDSALEFVLKKGGKTKKLTQTEIINISTNDPDRKLREAATKILSDKYNNESKFYTFVLNNLLLDKKINDNIRGYKYPQLSIYLRYDIDKKIVDTMTSTIVSNYKIAERFYLLKANLLKIKALHEWDKYSQITKVKTKKYSFKEAKQIVLKAFYKFDPEFSHIAEMFFENGWIDAKMTKNRKSGAYCSYLTPSKHPYIFMNFSGVIGDITTLAHELGHGMHAYLSKKNTLVNFWPSTATAEIASAFAESLVFNELFKQTKSTDVKINLLAEKIQRSFATVFRQNAFHLFENDIHKHRREKGELTTEDFSNYYQKRLQDSFGKGLKLTNDHKYHWMPILHFYHYNFYVFTYCFG